MRNVTLRDLVDCWESAQGRSEPGRAVTLLNWTFDARAVDHARLPLGARDRMLLELRQRLFGSYARARQQCPACGEELEAEFSTTQLRASAEEPAAGTERSAVLGGRAYAFRLPDSADLEALLSAADRDPEIDGARFLATRCVIRIDDVPTANDNGAFSAEIVEQLGERMAEADPIADIRLSARCPECDTAWNTPLNVAAFVWAEFDAWVRRLLGEVHQLATAYGWSESEILGLGPQRRSFYLRAIRS